jgi:dTDP-4-dehydrorhamnose reductase
MNLLLLGANGQLGSQLRVALAPLGKVHAPASCDITDIAAVHAAVSASACDVIVNAAAYTAVDRAESDRDAAFAVNATACEALAREAKAAGAWLFHYSTDYVYDGSGTAAWRETDRPVPLGVYGASKLAGDEAIQRTWQRHVILRTSWVYESGRDNFIASILKAAGLRDALTVVDDQWGTPTRAATIAQATAHIVARIQPAQAGLYHFASAGETNRFELARYALECAQARGWPLRATAGRVQPVATSQVPSAARRPLNSRLDCGLFDATFGFARPDWRADVRAAIDTWPAMPEG